MLIESSHRCKFVRKEGTAEQRIHLVDHVASLGLRFAGSV